MATDREYDVIVVGSGHAGIEAALASARIGCSTLLLTQNLDTIGQMSCNPAIGGSAKGQMVREIDALGGAMGANADATGIQFRMLNRAKGPSVWAPRVQCDKKAYQLRMKAILERTEGLVVEQAAVTGLRVEHDAVRAVETNVGTVIFGRSVVITSGTFLCALLHVGANSSTGGRMGDSVSGLSERLRGLGFKTGRFKTGTPCRINARSIDFSKCEVQPGEEPAPRFSYWEAEKPPKEDIFTLNEPPFHVEQLPCWITHTTSNTHQIIRDNLSRSPLYSGRIQGIGPRYCPSIEDKVVRFAEKTTHQIFLEPEGKHTEEMYVNGLSTSLPYDVQVAVVRSIPGLAAAEIMRPGYAVEYDYFPPTQLRATLETKLVENLYFAGQINGTSGYEEAGAQGLIAGANAALKVKGRCPLIVSRTEGYIGVLVDDLVTRGTDEPYRMFTSRAEGRLSFRQDNADQRLSPKGFSQGLLSIQRWKSYQAKILSLANLARFVSKTRVEGELISHLLKRPGFTYADLPLDVQREGTAELWQLLETDLKYEGYIRRQADANRRRVREEARPIPDRLEYAAIPGLSSESRSKLAAVRPGTFAQAAGISGVTPADISLISIWMSSNGL